MGGPGMGGPGMGPPGMMMGGGAKAKNFKGTMTRLIAYIGQYRVAVIAVWLIALVSTAFSIAGPKILGQATTKLFEGVMAKLSGKGEVDFASIGNILLFTLGLYVISAIFSYIQGWVMSGIAVKITYRFRRDLSEKMNRMPLRYFDGTNHGEVLSRITNDVDVVNQTLSQSLTQIVTSVATVLGVIVMMLSISWKLTLVALVIMPVSMVFVSFIIKRSQKLFKAQQEHLGHVNSHVEEMYGGHVVMKAFNGEKKSVEAFEKHNTKLYTVAWKSTFLSGLMMPMMMFIGNLGYVAISMLGGYYAVQKAITVGDIQAFIQYVRSFTMPLSQLANISNVLQQTAAAAERVFEFLDEKEESPETANPADSDLVRGHIEFRNVHFGYSPDKIIIKDFSAYADRGHKIAIVGPTGAGKTTMVKLLMRFYDLESGHILIDGIDGATFTRKDLRKCFGMVLQDTWLYNGSIMENIRYGRPEASDAEVFEAARTAHADHFIRAQPQGYETVINEEANNISQGQKQLLTIARAIIADPKMLILDEATSSVDTRTEILIQKAMDNLMKDRTSFIIAHRLSTVKNADLILVMKDGNIVEQGRHEELLCQRGFYAEIYNSQFDVTGTAAEECAS
ncbi:MAG: ABC transporter ATP-binding protein [Spirochaetota bacterium]